ncbi:MAG: hypothetical protein FJ388_01095, partial [Verrucomicrobia bacterium]|nr:hypothetical protein [Verrucomicrobiota bacterium]
MKTRCVWYVIGACVFTVGCSTTPKQAKLPRTGNTVEDAKVAIQQGPARDKVLWQYRGAIAAMREGHYDEAKQMLDDALRTVGGIIGPNKEGKRARSNFVAESKKTFIGEPYERVMAYFYRGILYWRDGELDNARACFLSAQFQDADAEKNEYKSDYVLLDYLAGLASAKLGGDGQDAFQRAQALNKSNPLPPYDPKANVIFFVELGYGPSKFATGQYAQQLRFRPGSSDSRAAGISLGKSAMQATCCDDLSFQATTRGGRVMDHVLANKAMFKSTAGTVGDVALVAGMATASSGIIYSNTDASIAGAALLAVAL